MHETLKDFLKNLFAEYSDGRVVSEDFFWSRFSEEVGKYDDESTLEFKKKLTNNEVTVQHVTNHGGEGKGEYYWSVYSFTKGTEKVYVQFDGWYQSFNGSEFSEWFFVAPKK